MSAAPTREEIVEEIVELLRCAADVNPRDGMCNNLTGVVETFGADIVRDARGLIEPQWQKRREWSSFHAFLLECALRLERDEWWT